MTEATSGKAVAMMARAVAPDDLARAAPVVVDVRSAAEFEAGHLPGAVHIPLDELARRRSELPPDRPVVAYCNLNHPGNARCERAADLLSSLGRDAAILAEGFTGWVAAGRPVAKGPA